MREQSPEAGYTLIELLVSILLVGFIGVALASGLHFGTRVWEESDTRISSVREITSAQTLMRELLAAALPKERGGFVLFEGDQRQVGFVAPAPSAFPQGGLAKVTFSTSSGSAGSHLIIRVTSLTDKDVTRETVLAHDVGLLKFSYLDASEKVPTWLSLWRDRKRLPDAVRLERQDEAGWPTLIVHPEISESHPCHFDSISMICRES